VPTARAIVGPRTLLAVIRRTTARTHVEGDHTIFVGRVQGAGASEGWPLVYFDGDYRGVRDWAPAVI
jgi:flavin reductase (DIM6/NTAB) family NADH-FMN oxidoreductase RutF